MKQEDYGENFYVHLLEQYKLCVEMADRISVRRGQANTFYISLLSAILALLSLIIDKNIVVGSASVLLFCTSIAGLALCLTWYANIQSYKQINSLKFKVINEMEQYLPFACYSREWEIREEKQKNGKKQYIRLTGIEKIVPLIFAFLYGGLLVYTLLVFVGIFK